MTSRAPNHTQIIPQPASALPDEVPDEEDEDPVIDETELDDDTDDADLESGEEVEEIDLDDTDEPAP